MKQTIQLKNKSFNIDIGFILILILFGLTSCFALYNAYNLIKSGSGSSYLFRQAFWFVVGFMTMYILSAIQNKRLYDWMQNAYLILMIMLGYLLLSRIVYDIIGYTLPLAPNINGAISWIQIPLIGSFQPSEFIKIVLIVLVSQTITKHQEQYKDPTFKNDLQLLVKIMKIVVPPLILILLQPDTGVCIIIGVDILILLCCSGIKKEYVIGIIILIIFAIFGFFSLYTAAPDFLAKFIDSYKLQRIEAWLDPESYILGSSNQLYTSLLSLGSAGIFGYGMQANVISIPEAQTDFIFAAFGQCFGLIGTTFIIVICILLDLYICRIAIKVDDKTDKLICVGVIAMLLYQQIQNIGMIIGLLPITGITLPLISYGGSSILSYFISFGIVYNISPTKKKTTRKKRR